MSTMTARFGRLALVAGVALAALAGCGGGDDDGDDAAVELEDVGDDETTTTEGDDEATTTTEADEGEDEPSGDGELPDFADEFDRVCSSQVGFDGAAAYDAAGAGPHVLVLFESFGADGDLVRSGRSSLPAGWLVEEDSDFEDNSELATVELVACLQRTEETANGTSCDFDDEGETVTLELVDTVHELTLYAAATGDEVFSTTLESASTECPFFVTFDPEDLRYFNEPTDDELIAALAPTVEP